MGNPSPIRVPSNVSNVKTIPDVVRYVSSCIQEMATQFNTLIANKDVWGVVGNTGFIGVTGSGNFIPSLLATGVYWVGFREPYFTSPTVLVSPTDVTVSVVWSLQGVTLTGFRLNISTWSANASTNNAFHFIAKGARNG
jgi:hypothetical protein